MNNKTTIFHNILMYMYHNTQQSYKGNPDGKR